MTALDSLARFPLVMDAVERLPQTDSDRPLSDAATPGQAHWAPGKDINKHGQDLREIRN
jgi:hypothetical protein